MSALTNIFETSKENTVPYSLDTRSPRDLENIAEDPRFLRSFERPRKAIVITDDTDLDSEAIREALENLHKTNLKFLLRANDEEIKTVRGWDDEDLEDVREWAQKLQDDETTIPEEVDYYLDRLKKAVDDQSYRARSDHDNNYIVERRVGGRGNFGRPHGLRTREYTLDIQSAEIIYIPSGDFDHHGLLEKFTAHYETSDWNKTPGTSQEWAAIISYHEMEHIADDAQEPITDFFVKKSEELGLSKTDLVLMKEIEADCGAFNALEDMVSQEVKDHWIALRIMSTMPIEFLASKDEENATLNARHTHTTGFHLAHYNETGDMPNYQGMQESINGFYNKLYNKWEESAEEYGVNNHNDMIGFVTNPSDVLGLVQELKVTGEFTPQQGVIADQFMKSAKETLGITENILWRENLIDAMLSKEIERPEVQTEAKVTAEPEEIEDVQENAIPQDILDALNSRLHSATSETEQVNPIHTSYNPTVANDLSM